MTFICHSDGSSIVKIMVSRMQVYLVCMKAFVLRVENSKVVVVVVAGFLFSVCSHLQNCWCHILGGYNCKKCSACKI
jgi:hypothetical protein